MILQALECTCFRCRLQVFGRAAAAITSGQAPNSRACKYTLNMLMNCCSNPAIAQVGRQGVGRGGGVGKR